MKFSDAYKGSYLKAADLGGAVRRYTIESIGKEEIRNEKKVVMRFEEEDSALVLNKTNAVVLMEAWGDNMEDWVGNVVLLQPAKTDFEGKRVDCIRVAAPKKKTPAPVAAEEESDDINV